ncbi:hypothetical protein [Thalassoporum mexicanum]|uniref:hypothetical protein n=1 Tax=Thalassoporum mexicanum TaxID=3457544 RepID=UPI0012E9EAB7|nr:hypothetical protein [Pseudanabaena sp. PCC 7367]
MHKFASQPSRSSGFPGCAFGQRTRNNNETPSRSPHGWHYWLRIFILSICLQIMPLTTAIAEAATTWRIAGKPVISFAYEDAIANRKINQLDQRLEKIVVQLNPNQAWQVDVQPTQVEEVAASSSSAGSEPAAKTKIVKAAAIRLQGQTLIEVTETDVQVHNATSVLDLANSWARSLSQLFAQPDVRQRLTATVGLPPQIGYRGAIYQLEAEVAIDRGLFRTNGDRVNGKIIFWQVPVDQNVYNIGLKPEAPEEIPEQIFTLNRNLLFIPYRLRQN